LADVDNRYGNDETQAERLARIEQAMSSHSREQKRHSEILVKLEESSHRVAISLERLAASADGIKEMQAELSAINKDIDLYKRDTGRDIILHRDEINRDVRRIWDRIHEMEKAVQNELANIKSDVRDIKTYAKAYMAALLFIAGAASAIGSFIANIVGG
jgi:chromosome segregation ATPase